MMIRFFRMGRALPAVLPLFAFWLPGTAAGLTFHEALRLAGQHAPSLSAEAARVQAVRSEAIAVGHAPTSPMPPSAAPRPHARSRR